MKYELTAETKTVLGVTLHRIRALIDIGLNCGILIKKGEVGGWVEDENNLNQEGDAWVSGNAQVSGDARVYGNAQVSGDARVYGNAQVYGNARVYGDAQVYGDAWVYGDAQVSGDAWVYGDAHLLTIGKIGSRSATTTFTRDKAGTIMVACGCFYGTLDEFRAKVRKTHGYSKHAKVYLLAADLAEAQIDTTPITEENPA